MILKLAETIHSKWYYQKIEKNQIFIRIPWTLVQGVDSKLQQVSFQKKELNK